MAHLSLPHLLSPMSGGLGWSILGITLGDHLVRWPRRPKETHKHKKDWLLLHDVNQSRWPRI